MSRPNISVQTSYLSNNMGRVGWSTGERIPAAKRLLISDAAVVFLLSLWKINNPIINVRFFVHVNRTEQYEGIIGLGQKYMNPIVWLYEI